MTIFPPDQRSVIDPGSPLFPLFPFPAVAAVDVLTTRELDEGTELVYGFGSGITITPNHVLTNAHVIYDFDSFDPDEEIEIRVSTSEEQQLLISRRIRENNVDPAPNVIDIHLDDAFLETNEYDDDIALLRTRNRDRLLNEDEVIGLIAFVNTEDAIGFAAETAGYPFDNVTQPIPGNSGMEGRDLVIAPTSPFLGNVVTTFDERLYTVDSNIDVIEGQSGSGIWSSYQEDPLRVFGLINFGFEGDPPPRRRGGNGGILITTDLYTEIINQTEADIGSGNADILPENLIIGSDTTSDQIEGTYRRERILGLGGNDTISGKGADDRLEGNEGDDSLDGGTGKDIITGGAGNDLIDGGTNTFAIINPFNRENDVAVYSAPISEYRIETDTSDGLFGSPIGGETVTTITHLNGGIDGQDTLTNIEILVFSDGAVPLSSDDDIIDDLLDFIGGDDDDDIVGNILDNRLRGGSGNDRLEGDDGNDTLEGGRGNDLLLGGNDLDTLLGGNDLDRLFGNAGNDSLNGENGNDSLYGEAGSDTLRGGNGNDYLSGGDNNDSLVGDSGNDNLRGELGNDRILGSGGNDSIKGGSGNDTVYAQADDDQIFGNDGDDFLSGDRGNDRLLGNEGNDRIQGGSGNDTVYAQADDDRIFGNNGDDFLSGDRGNDFIYGGAGNDTLIGGSGSDRFVYNTNRSFRLNSIGKDTIRNFDDGDNRIVLDKSTFDVINSQAGVGFSRKSEFAVVSRDSLVASSNASILYSSSTGNLFYNQNGTASGLGSGGLFATLEDAPAISASDFQIVN